MADQSDVETELVSLIATAIYPAGETQPSVFGSDCRIYRGWPTSTALNNDLAAGRINVSVYPADGGGTTTTRFPDTWAVIAPVPPTLTVTVTGTSASFAGEAATGQLAGLLIDGSSFAYAVSDTDTPDAVAANLAALARAAGLIVQLAGTTIIVPFAGTFTARVVAGASAMKEVRRQLRLFRVSCWCPTPESRDTAASVVDLALADLRFIPLPDGSFGRLVFGGSVVVDQSQNAALYRRDLLYSVEFATTITAIQPAMLFGDLDLNSTTYTA